MISVCIATYNGGKYIKEQLDSILFQLGKDDEVIISDDSSTDDTLSILESYHDERIVILTNQKFHSPVYNFENALKSAKGDFIFLSDQDDIWEPTKVEVMLDSLKFKSLVVSDCCVIDQHKKIVCDSLFNSKIPTVGILSNILHNHYIGCCMAFRREVLNKALPFPPSLAMHDIWIGLCAATFYSATFLPNRLIKYRRHGNNASPELGKSDLPLLYRIQYRWILIMALLRRILQKNCTFSKRSQITNNI